ncbi:MAG: hypothetical protein NT059_03335 [Planctomycetota bacterium]|nr:hypothetical protein [Planctomycetota bacterium]
MTCLKQLFRGHSVKAATCALVVMSCSVVAPPAPETEVPPAPKQRVLDAPSAPAAPALPRFADADALLTAVERTSDSLRDFRANITLETTDDVTGDTERRLGQVVFVQDEGKPSTRRFAVVFEKFIDGSGRMDERPVRYIYADGWLTEADFKQCTLVRRQLARAGEQYDPLKPGEGPVPLPIGQRRADVLARFDASLATAPNSALLLKSARPIVGVRLKPKPGMADRDLMEASVWYDAESLVPVGVEAQRKSGKTVVSLRGATMNGGIDDAQRALLSLGSEVTNGWRVDERPLAAAPGAGNMP